MINIAILTSSLLPYSHFVLALFLEMEHGQQNLPIRVNFLRFITDYKWHSMTIQAKQVGSQNRRYLPSGKRPIGWVCNSQGEEEGPRSLSRAPGSCCLNLSPTCSRQIFSFSDTYETPFLLFSHTVQLCTVLGNVLPLSVFKFLCWHMKGVRVDAS